MLKPVPKTAFDWLFSLMEQSFPPTEMRTKEGQKAVWEKEQFHAWMDEQRRGFLTAWSLGDWLYLEHFAVDPSARGTGVGARMLQEFLAQAKAPVFFEVELPETEIAKRRIGFYERMGCILNPYDYIQPPYRTEEAPLEMKIMSYPAPLDQDTFCANRQMLYQTVYGRRP